ncbi:CPBP family intramembrane glutamic endopeptidase [Saccharopolyspora sp. NPDC050642]|uniref:CPBP family intramembrane glutamic endopeptidase n=1 Tax=Saccharopolyspora sp. NPDC050642 TaxID=3157099 RepID=UPI0033DD1244
MIHAAADPWLNLYYFTLGASLAVITWRTGGIETAVVIHAVNNTLWFLFLIAQHGDFFAGADRSAGSSSAIMLVPSALAVTVAAVVWFATRRNGPAVTPKTV